MTADDQQQDMSEREADANALATYADRVAALEGEVASLTQTLKLRSAALDRVTATNGTATARMRELEAEAASHHGRLERARQSARRAGLRAESAEAERDALQQRLDEAEQIISKVNAYADSVVRGRNVWIALDLRTITAGMRVVFDPSALAAPAVSSRPGMTVTEAVADALNDRSENTGQITGGTPQKPQQEGDA